MRAAWRVAGWLPAFFLAACAGSEVRHSVTRPLQEKLGAVELFVDRPEVSFREAEAQGQAGDVAGMTVEELRAALAARELSQAAAAPWRVRSQVYIAWRGTRVRDTGSSRWQPGYVEVRIDLVNLDGGVVRYSTFSKASIEPAPTAEWFGWGAERQEIIREIIRSAAADFASRL